MTVHNATPKKLQELAEEVGYKVDRQKGKGSHIRMYLKGRPPITLPMPGRKRMSANAARDTMKKIKMAREAMEKLEAA